MAATPGIYKGTIMRLFDNGVAFADAVECTVSITTEMIETSSKDTGGGDFAAFEPGQTSFTLSTNMLIRTTGQNGKFTVDKQLAKTKFEMVLSNDNAGDWELAGDCYCSSSTITATNKENVTGDFQFQGTGTLVSAITA